MGNTAKKQKSGALAALVLLGVFMVCVLAVLLTGADALQRLSRRDQASYTLRTAGQYVATKVRQADSAGMIWVGGFDAQTPGTQGDTLFLEEEGEVCTRVYCRDGWLYELYAQKDGRFAPQDGERVMQAEYLWFTLEGDVLNVELLLADGEAECFALSLRSGEVGL